MHHFGTMEKDVAYDCWPSDESILLRAAKIYAELDASLSKEPNSLLSMELITRSSVLLLEVAARHKVDAARLANSKLYGIFIWCQCVMSLLRVDRREYMFSSKKIKNAQFTACLLFVCRFDRKSHVHLFFVCSPPIVFAPVRASEYWSRQVWLCANQRKIRSKHVHECMQLMIDALKMRWAKVHTRSSSLLLSISLYKRLQ